MIEQSFVSILNTSDKKNPWRAGQTYPPISFPYSPMKFIAKKLLVDIFKREDR